LSLRPYESARIILIRSLSELHPGTGRGGEIADLMVQRDGVGFPVIYSSSLKGAMKSSLYHKDRVLHKLLGPEPEEGEKFLSPIAVMTSYMLSFPVRSLIGICTNVTSPFLLKRFASYLDMASTLRGEYEMIAELIKKIISFEKNPATTGFKKKHVVERLGKAVLCEEFEIKEDSIEEKEEMDQLKRLIGLDDSETLISLNDNIAKGLVERSLLRITRIAIDRSKKTVKEKTGPWTEEAVPPGTIFFTALLSYGEEYLKRYLEALSNKASEEEKGKIADLKRELEEERTNPIDIILRNSAYLIIGGDETVGRGIVTLRGV